MSTPDAPEPGKYGVQAGSLAAAIYVGRLNAEMNAFVEKEVATDMAIAAVAQYVERHWGGGMVIEFPGLGIDVEVTVTPHGKGDGG